MFSGKQFGILGVIAGANLLLSLLVSTVGGSLGAQGPTGQTGPQGPQGSTGETGADGTPVEFSVENGVLVWRYVGETEWNELDLEISGGGSITTGSSEGYFTNWMFTANPSFNFDYRSRIIVNDSATYATNLVTNEGYTAVSSIADLQAIDDTEEALSGKYVLTSDIDLTTWTPDYPSYLYSVVTGSFSGVFDGAGYEISNYSVDTTDTSNSIYGAGLFARLDGATVQNLNLINFTFEGGNQIYEAGALAGDTNDNYNRPTIVDQVSISDVTFTSVNNSLDRLGGFIGETNSDVSFIRSTANNIRFVTDNSVYSVGGFFGRSDTYDTLEFYEVVADVTLETITPNQNRYVERVGGVGGFAQNSATILAYQVTSSFTGDAQDYASGFISTVAGESKVILKEVDVTVDITSSNPDTGSSVGGLFGFYGRDGLLFADDVSVTGSIEGYMDVGGLIGYGKYGSTVKISNSSVDVSLSGDERIGGIVGYLNENRHKWMFNNLIVEAEIIMSESVNSSGHYGGYYAGVVGVIDDRNNSDTFDTNQIWINDSTVDLTVAYEVNEPASVEDLYYEMWNVGGFIAEVNEYNEIRITNSTATVDVSFNKVNSTNLTYFGFNLNEVGGAIGYTEDSNVLLLNVETELTVSTTFEGFTTTEEGNYYLDQYIEDIGGAVGEIDSGQVTIVAGSYEVNLVQSFQDITSTKHDYEFSTQDVGGFVGYLDDNGLLLIDDSASTLIIDITIANITIADGETLDIYVRDIGSLIGRPDGIALISDTTRVVEFTTELPEENDKINLEVVETVTDLGQNNPFVFIND